MAHSVGSIVFGPTTDRSQSAANERLLRDLTSAAKRDPFVHHVALAPRRFKWSPEANISAHELALALPVLLDMAASRYGFDIGQAVDALPAAVKRHFQAA